MTIDSSRAGATRLTGASRNAKSTSRYANGDRTATASTGPLLVRHSSATRGRLVSAYGVLTANTATGAYLFTPNAGAIEGLDVGENPSLNFTLTVSDGISPAVTQPYTINLTGADDTPTLQAVTAGSIAEVDQSSSTTSSGLSG